MTWPAVLVVLFAIAFAAGLVLAISTMLAMKIVAAVTAAVRWCWGRS